MSNLKSVNMPKKIIKFDDKLKLDMLYISLLMVSPYQLVIPNFIAI